MSPVATPVAASSSQNVGVSGASPSPVTFGCSVAPRPEGSRRRTRGGGILTRSDGPAARSCHRCRQAATVRPIRPEGPLPGRGWSSAISLIYRTPVVDVQ